MRVLFAVAVIVSIALTGSPVSASSWLPDGGLSGRTINALIVNQGALFAGTSDSGVYRSSDKGQSWLAMNAGLTDFAITSLTSKDGFLFAGTVSGGVFRSADSGRTWLPMNTGISSTNIKALAANNSCIFAGTGGGGVCRSTNYGTNWLEVNKLEDGTDLHFKNIFSFGVTADYVFIGTWGGSAFRSADNGTIWYMVTNGMAMPSENQIPRCFAVLDSYIFTGLDNGGGMLRARDSARVWFTVNTGLPGNTSVTALAVFKNSLYAATDKGVFHSTDYADSWSSVNSGLSNTPVLSFASIDTTLFAGTSNGIWQSNPTLNVSTSMVRPTQAVVALQSKFLSLSGSAITYQTGNLSGIVTVCSPNGAIVLSKKITGTGTINFNRQELARGLYIIQLQVGQWQDHRMLFR